MHYTVKITLEKRFKEPELPSSKSEVTMFDFESEDNEMVASWWGHLINTLSKTIMGYESK